MIELLGDDADTPSIVAPLTGPSFEFGTPAFRASVLRRALEKVPEGVPVIVSDDPDVWRAAAQLANRNPVIGVLHADEAAYYGLAKQYANSVTAFVAVSSRIARKAADQLGGGAEVAVIPCGIAVAAALPERPPSDRVLRLVWVGRIDEHQKRVSDLVRMCAVLQRRRIDFNLRILGDGPDRESLRAAALEAALADRLSWTGWLMADAVRDVLRQSDVLLLPSNFEGMPVVAMEALAEGCGVVASRVSGIEDYEHASVATGSLFVHEIGDVDAAADAVMMLAATPRAVRQERAWRFARSEFAVGVSVDRYERVLDAVRGRAVKSPVAIAPRSAMLWRVAPRAWWRWVRTWVAQRA